MEKDRKRWMKPKEVAEYFSVHVKTIYRMISAHELPGVKIKGAGWRIDRKKLDNMLEGEMEERERKWNKIFDF
ncbi:MAG: helix-turn-helix domain-containing protein [Candidatus Aminicenantaceae bacterium]